MITNQPADRLTNQPTGHFLSRLMPYIVFLLAFALYAATAAPGVLFGDPSEYQFVPATLAIAHPPGYAFYTLLAKLWQTLVPVGSIAYRTNLLAAAAGAWVVTAAYLTVHDLQYLFSKKPVPFLPPLFAALCLAVAPDLWQHAIHSNAHIVSAALTATHLWLLARWWRTRNDRWLMALAFVFGLSATHHPITLMGAPAYAVFVLLARPNVLRRWRLLLVLIGCLLLGLLPLLYYPLRSPNLPPGFQPTDMNTWEGFVRHTTAKGLRVNFSQFGLADQPDRALVFWTLLRLQFSLPIIALIVLGLIALIRRAPKLAALLGLFLALHLFFTMNFYQDTMAYLLNPFAALAVVAGLGVLALSEILNPLVRPSSFVLRRWLFATGCFLVLALPISQAILNLQRSISLRDFTAAEDYVSAVYERFAGRGEGAVLLTDWERLTPLFVRIYAEGKPLDETDVKLVFVNSADGPTWVRNVWEDIEEGPIYVVGYRPALRDEGFRLVPDGPFYRIVAPPVTDVAPTHPLDMWADGRVHILGYDLYLPSEGEDGGEGVRAGEPLGLVLYQGVAEQMGEDEYWMPYAQLGPVEARWTTDSRLNTPWWQPGEIVVEKYEIPVPFDLPPGEYPLRLGYSDLSGGRPELTLSAGGTTVELTTITVLPPSPPLSPPLGGMQGGGMLANLDNQIALMGARARAGWQVRWGKWDEPLVARPGQALHLTLTWRALASPRDVHSQNVFVHLIDGANRLVVGRDAPPLGGAFPTTLWFPKWLPGQTVDDPCRLVIPETTPPGDYRVEVGMYEMTSLRRLPVVDLGNLAGDRVILGPVRVE
jgi:hypothetical protein